MNKKERLRNRLLTYVNHYHHKPHLRMKQVTNGIIQRLINHQDISDQQFRSLIKFLEREREFQSMDRETIQDHFQPIIYNSYNPKRGRFNVEITNTLEPFLQ